MAGAADFPTRPADHMRWWAAETGFSPPYFCPAHGEDPAGYKMLVTGTPGEDELLAEELRELLIASDVEQFDFAAALRRDCLGGRQLLLSWRSSADAVRALGAFEARRRPRGIVLAARWWIPQGYDPRDHDPRFAPRRAAAEALDVEPERA